MTDVTVAEDEAEIVSGGWTVVDSVQIFVTMGLLQVSTAQLG